MRILVLGNSDTRGDFAAGATWPEVARASLSANGDDVVLHEERFSALTPTAAEYARRKVAEFEPDIVVVPLGTFAFSVGFTWVRVQRLFGQRIADRYRRAEEAFDTHTRPAGQAPGRLNNAARRITRRIIGARPLTTRDSLVESYRHLLQVLAQPEGLDVLLVAYPPEEGRLVKVRNLPEERERLLCEIQSIASRHHFRLLDTAPVLAGAPGLDPLITPDGFHLRRGGHHLVGEAVALALRER